MRILQINTVSGHGSTGSIALDIAIELEKAGHDAYIAYGHGVSSYSKSFKIGSWLEKKLHGFLFSRILGLQGYGSYLGTRKLLRLIDRIKPDIIHLHNLHGNYLNHPQLFKYIIRYNIPVVFTLHDCYHFTGKCSHYTAAGCYKWQSECSRCPLLHHTIAPSYFFDRSNKIFRDKRSWYHQIERMYTIAVSGWLEHQAKQSILAVNGHPVKRIYNWIDSKRFFRSTAEDVDKLRKKYALSATTNYVVSIGAGWNKKTTKFQDAQRLAAQLPEGYKLLLVGAVAKGTQIKSPICHIPYLSDPRELAAIYSMAVAYIHLSVEDTFGKVIAEAMACGTPPVVYDSTACSEVAGGFGFVVAPHDVDAIVNLLPRLNISAERRAAMVEYVKTHYDYAANIRQYIESYISILT